MGRLAWIFASPIPSATVGRGTMPRLVVTQEGAMCGTTLAMLTQRSRDTSAASATIHCLPHRMDAAAHHQQALVCMEVLLEHDSSISCQRQQQAKCASGALPAWGMARHTLKVLVCTVAQLQHSES